jgi:hypothetical protein
MQVKADYDEIWSLSRLRSAGLIERTTDDWRLFPDNWSGATRSVDFSLLSFITLQHKLLLLFKKSLKQVHSSNLRCFIFLRLNKNRKFHLRANAYDRNATICEYLACSDRGRPPGYGNFQGMD